jgi:hypothetical protein
MNTNKNALLLIGSPKGENSTSASLGSYLISKLEEFGMKSEKAYIHRLVTREETVPSLIKMINSSDLIILSFPLYVDSLPAPVIKAMELIKKERYISKSDKTQSFIAISNNGFPEASQNMTALQICKIFSEDCGFIWKGGIAVGGGGAISGIPLQERGGMVRNIVKGLDIVAQALKDGNDIPQETFDLISKNIIPSALYRFFGNFGWKLQARKHGAKKKLKEKPYK